MCGITSCCFCVEHATGSMAGSAVAAVFCALNLIIQIIIGFLPGIAVNALMFLSCLPLYLGSKKRKHFYLIPFLIIYGLGTPTDLGIAFYQVIVDTFKSWHWIPLLATAPFNVYLVLVVGALYKRLSDPLDPLTKTVENVEAVPADTL